VQSSTTVASANADVLSDSGSIQILLFLFMSVLVVMAFVSVPGPSGVVNLAIVHVCFLQTIL